MIGRALDSVISAFSPQWGLKRIHARRVMRSYQGGESNRLTAHKSPKNLSADQELAGPFGADSVRAYSRMLVRDNAYAWGVVDTIVSSVVGCGIKAQSMLETKDGTDIENTNWKRDEIWDRWCEVCDINGRLNFDEIQALAQREIVEAGEVLIHKVKVPLVNRGIMRDVPLALELIEADRLASERDGYLISRQNGIRIQRGIELDELGRPIAYWIYPAHPLQPNVISTTPQRIPASEIIHLFRQDRIGQTRGISWFAPVVQWLRDLGTYVDNEMQASAVQSCFTVAVKTNSTPTGLLPSNDGDSVDSDGNKYEYLQPGQIMYLQPGESIESANPGRMASQSDTWISLMLRGIAVGTGLSYEIVARDYSRTTYSSSRTSQLEDRRRFRRWQGYLKTHLCQPIWDAFCDAAAVAGVESFPTMTDLLENRRASAPVEWQTPEWEWVDPQNEQQASQSSIDAFQSTYQAELGSRGRNWRQVFYQRAKEEKLKRELGLVPVDVQLEQAAAQANMAAATTGEMMGLSTLQFKRNRKAIDSTLNELASGQMTEAKARVFLASIGMAQASIDALITDALDGTVDTQLPVEDVANVA
jgi:lambda family phage portal protein